MKFSALALAIALVASSGLTAAAFAQTNSTPAPTTSSKSTSAHKAVHHKGAMSAKNSTATPSTAPAK